MPLTFAKDAGSGKIIHINDVLILPDHYRPVCPFCQSPLKATFHYTQTPYFVHDNQETCRLVTESQKLYLHLTDHLWFIIDEAEYKALLTLSKAYGKSPFHLNPQKKNDPAYAFNKLPKQVGISYIFERLLNKELIKSEQRNKYVIAQKALDFFGKGAIEDLSKTNTQQRRDTYALVKKQSQKHDKNRPQFDGSLKYLQKISAPLPGVEKPSAIRATNRQIYEQVLAFLEGKSTTKPNLLLVRKPNDDAALGKSTVFKVFETGEGFFMGPEEIAKDNVTLKQHYNRREFFLLAEMAPLFQAITQESLHKWEQQKQSYEDQLHYLEFLDEQLPELQLVFLKNTKVRKYNHYYFFYTYFPDPYELPKPTGKLLGKSLGLFVTYLNIPPQLYYYFFNAHSDILKIVNGIPMLQTTSGGLTYEVFDKIKDYKYVSTPAYRGIMIKKARDEYAANEGRVYGRSVGSTEDLHKFLNKPKNIQILKALSNGLTLRNIMDQNLGSDHLAKKVMVKFYEALYQNPASEAFARQLIEEHDIDNLGFFEKYKKAIQGKKW